MKKLILILSFLSLNLLADEVYKEVNPKHLGHGSLGDYVLKENAKSAWPLNVKSIGHTLASFQSYSSWRSYFHHGLDIRGEAGENVYSSTSGKVVNVEKYGSSSLYWEVAILDNDGFLWQYHHVDPKSIPQDIKDAFKNGGSIEAGTKIGEIVRWPVTTFGERFHHIHLNILDKNKNYLNPFIFLELLDDKQAPVAKAIKKERYGNGYTLTLEVEDLIMHERFIVPPYHTEIAIDGGEFETFWKFDTIPGGAVSEDHVEEFYFKKATCGNYNCRKLVFDLGFIKDETGVRRRTFPSSRGKHSIKVRLTDYAGNTSTKEFDFILP